MRPPIARAPRTLVFLAVALAVIGCGGEASSPPPSYPPGAIVVTARSLTFDTSQLVVPANAPFTLVLVNEDSAAHNIAIRTQPGFDGEIVFRFDPISKATFTAEVGPIAAGTYYFLCEVHPQMTGTVVAQ